MPRTSMGTIESYNWKDGRTISWRLRVRAYGRRWRIDLGTNHEGWSEQRAQVELDRVMSQIERGTWEPPAKQEPPAAEPEIETFHVFASRWWARRRGELTDRGRADYEWRLGHLLAFFKDTPVAEIDTRLVDEYRAARVAERDLVASGGRLPGKRRPLSNRSINMTLVLLSQILDDAVEYDLLSGNPASGKKRRLKQGKTPRNFLEPDMVLDLLDVAGEWEREVPPHQRYGRRAFLALLCLGGPRIEEAIAYTRGQLDVHAGVIRGGLKTAAGRDRHVDLTRFVLDELRGHAARNADAGADELLFPTRTGGRLNPSNIRNRLLKESVERANAKRAVEGRLLLPPKVTPHTLRRTFASLCFMAGRDARYVMAQLGHADARLTLEVYAQILERRRVDHDLVWSLMRFADEPESWPGAASFGPRNGPTTPELPSAFPAKATR